MKRYSGKTIWFPALIVFAAVMFVALSSFFVSLDTIDIERQKVIDVHSKNAQEDIQRRVVALTEVLWAGSGLLAATDDTMSLDWMTFVKTSEVLERNEGLHGIGYSEVIAPSALDAFTREARKTVDEDFIVFPEGERDLYTAITLLEPLDERNQLAIGYDMYSDETRRMAMDSARDSKDAALTQPVRLIQENDVNEQKGLLLYVPHYKQGEPIETEEQRQAAIEGYVYGILRSETFLSNLLADSFNKDIGISIGVETAGANEEIFQTDNYNQLSDKSSSVYQFQVKNTIWTAKYVYDPIAVLPQAFSARASTVLLFGVFAATLVSGVTYLLLRGKSNELALAKEKDISSAKDSLLSIASHQLRTPATGVKQYLGMVLQGFVGTVSGPQNAMLQKAYESNERQLKTINDILFLARLDSGRIVLSKAETDMQNLVRSVIGEQVETIEESKHTIKTKLPKKSIHAEVDPHMLHMALENLLSNAVKYTKNEGTITIQLRESDDNIFVSVSDDGVGIDEEGQRKLFKQFSRVPNELTKSVSGTGIGLYLVKHIMELHGGTINVASAAGEGSTFIIELPKVSRTENPANSVT